MRIVSLLRTEPPQQAGLRQPEMERRTERSSSFDNDNDNDNDNDDDIDNHNDYLFYKCG